MNTENDIAEYFFSLVYSQNPPSDIHIDPSLFKLDSQIEVFAIILSCNERNQFIFLNMPIFQDLLKHFKIKAKSIQSLQKSVLDFIGSQNDLKLIEDIFDQINILKTAGIILYEEEQCIKTSFKHKIYALSNAKKYSKKSRNKKVKPPSIENSWFYNHIQNIKNISKDIASHSNMPLWLQDIIKEQVKILSEIKFKISLSGIAKSGKSTLLNALLHQEVLPISAIPQTTNKITIFHHTQSKGEIVFLTQDEWNRILENLYFDDELYANVKENQKSFGYYFDSSITKTGLKKEIKPEEIKTYASSDDYSKISYLVKEIIIYSPIEFLKNNLIFINTPNIDTGFNYKIHQMEGCISESIITLHLVNASKPINQKDIDFLSNIILYENLEKILIVFTRADLVSLNELKTLSQNILKEIENSFEFQPKILKKNIHKIDFIPLSSTLALLHRTQQADEALSRGYDIEDTGILTLEEYINEIIFKQPTHYSKKYLNNAYEILETSIEKYLSKEITDSPKKSDLIKKLSAIKQAVNVFSEKIIEDINITTQKAKVKIKDLSLNLKEHLIDFISYEASKNNYINSSRLKDIIANNLKDSLKYLIDKTQQDFNRTIKDFIENIDAAYALVLPKNSEFESKMLKMYQKQITETTKYQYTQGDLNLYTEEIKKYISYILYDGVKFKDIPKNIDKAFELSYKNITTYLEEKINAKKSLFYHQVNTMIKEMEALIINTHLDAETKITPKESKYLKEIQQNIAKEIKALKELK